MPVEGPPALAGKEEHRPRQIPGGEEGRCIREHVEGEPPRARLVEGDRVGMAGYGHSDDESPSRGKKHRPQPH
jgi:hypothetical protein